MTLFFGGGGNSSGQFRICQHKVLYERTNTVSSRHLTLKPNFAETCPVLSEGLFNNDLMMDHSTQDLIQNLTEIPEENLWCSSRVKCPPMFKISLNES